MTELAPRLYDNVGTKSGSPDPSRGLLPKAGALYLNVPGNAKGAKQAFEDGLTLGGNTIYVPGAAPKVQLSECGTMSFAQFQATGVDLTTVVKDQVDAAAIVAMGKAVLEMP